jgi:hypothetical protein
MSVRLTYSAAVCLASTLLLAGTGCTQESGQQADDVTQAVTIRFDDDFSEKQSAALIEGRAARVVYDTDRLGDCRGQFNGKPAWTITGFYSFNGDKAHTFWAGGFSPTGESKAPEIELEEAGDLAFWFQIHNRWGCNAWDSDFGKNYHFQVKPSPRADEHEGGE